MLEFPFPERFNVKYQIFSTKKWLMFSTHFTKSSRIQMRLSINDRLPVYKTKIASKLCHCVSFYEGINL